ncbi:MAG: hypothetical protein ABI148_00600 [Ginsengibacter sp.]
MENISTEILTELKAISPLLAEMEKLNIFQVPEEYFPGLEQRILTTIFINQGEKNNLQKVPDGYFDSLPDRIISKIKGEKNESVTDEIKALSPALFYLKEENTFTIPANYFDDLSDRILDKINGEKSKVISISSAGKWWKYAAAAVVAGVIAISSLQIFNHTSNSNNKAIVAASTNMPDYRDGSSQYKTPEKLKQGIASLSDDEIVNYLETTGSILDEETITKNLDAKEFPNAEDYLIDENTLKNFLKKTNAGSDKNIQ